jgi:hypothetical protein
MNMMHNHKIVNENSPTQTGAIGILSILVIISVLALMNKRDYPDYEELTRCPSPGVGQQLIGRGHMEADGQTGELMCTYSTGAHNSQARAHGASIHQDIARDRPAEGGGK